MTLAPATRLGHYDMVSLASSRGMGEVHKARDTRLDRIVAIKILPATLGAVIYEMAIASDTNSIYIPEGFGLPTRIG